MKVAIWTYIPTHHQSSFFEALRREGIDLSVRYCYRTLANRVQQGWVVPDLVEGEAVINPDDLFADMRDWRSRIHIIGGYGLPPLWRVIRRLCSANVPWVHWSEQPNPGFRKYLFHPLRMFYGQIINHYAMGALAISHLASAAFANWGISPDRIAILPYSLRSPAVTSPDSACQEFICGRKSFIFLGHLNKNKGADILIRAFSLAAQDDSDWVLVLVGGCSDFRYYENICASLGINHRVMFRGTIASDAVGNVITLGDVSVLPTKFKDGWGVALAEAASLGLPLIASDRVGAAYHLVDPGVNGYRVVGGSVESLANAMRAYVRHPELLKKHGQESKRIYSEYTPECNARRLVRILRSWKAFRE